MKITIRAAGLIKSGPERELIDEYVKRASSLARNLGITSVDESSVDTRGAKSRSDETEAILSTPSITPANILVILDERGKTLSSRQIAKQIAHWRDDGNRHVTFAIGGADGFAPNTLPANVVKWSFGQQTWPHKMVRVMICEQIYRALSILSNSPYHRD